MPPKKKSITKISITASVETFTSVLRKNKIGWEDVKGNKNEITTRVDGAKQIWLQDPDGYWIEINDARE